MGPRGFQSRLNLGNFKMRHYQTVRGGGYVLATTVERVRCQLA
jgi:hypothetical protein